MTKRKQPFTFEEFKSIYSRVPRLSVEAVMQTDDGLVLLQRENPPQPGSWHMPGGTVLMNETLEQAVRRIVEEELGVDCEVGEMLGVFELNFEDHFEHIVSIAFAVTPKSKIITSERTKVFPTLPAETIRFQKEFLRDIVGIPSE